MSKQEQSVHLICNSHIDPVWQWQWQEGAATAISTFRTAVELCEQNETFIFNHNEVILYKWIEEYDPALFKRIKKLVKSGRWHIMGGWYLQPDCNMPSGESLVRQILLGKNYFKQKFNADVKTAINFDPFGHCRGLVQILARSGYNSYLFGRPEKHCLELPAENFIWIGYDGSRVTATRFTDTYTTSLGKARKIILERIRKNPDQKVLAVLWGVGNHGGGPSRLDLKEVNQLINQQCQLSIKHSTPEAYFKELCQKNPRLPSYQKGLNPWAVGCYTSMVQVKQKHRQLENALYSLEKEASTASVNGLMDYPSQKIHEALCDLMMCEFHDILPGTSVQPVEEDALRVISHGLEMVSRLRARAFFALTSGQSKAKKNEIPILVYNPHPYPVHQIFECELGLQDYFFDLQDLYTNIIMYKDGKIVPCQVERELSNSSLDWRKRIVFRAELQAGQMNRFDCRTELLETKPSIKRKPQKGKIIFRTDRLEVIVNTRTGFVDRLRIDNVDCVHKNTFEPLVMLDNDDPWGMLVTSFGNLVGRFRLLNKKTGSGFSGIHDHHLNSVRIIEDGPVRCVIEAVFGYGSSFICQRYKLPRFGTEIELETRVHWNEKDRMLKLSVPVKGNKHRFIGQTVYGQSDLPTDGTEAVAQKWVAVVSPNQKWVLSCINTGSYGSDFSPDGLRLSLLRSPAYASIPISYSDKLHLPQDRYSPRIDQGERVFRFWFNAGTAKERLGQIEREALAKNEIPTALSMFPAGKGKRPKPLAILSDNVVQMNVLKKAENNKDLIVRLFEPTGRKRSTVLSLPALRMQIKVNMKGFEIKTLRINVKKRKWVETDLLENPKRA